MEKQFSEIRIYVACLASYNNGYLHGKWIEADQGLDHIQDEVAEMLKASPLPRAEEWAIHDYEGFSAIQLSEYTSFETVVEFAEFLEEHGDLGAEVYAYYNDLDDARTALEDHYAGEYDSLEDFAEQLTLETSEVPENLAYYIDYEKMGRDLAINDVLAIEGPNGQKHIFWQH